MTSTCQLTQNDQRLDDAVVTIVGYIPGASPSGTFCGLIKVYDTHKAAVDVAPARGDRKRVDGVVFSRLVRDKKPQVRPFFISHLIDMCVDDAPFHRWRPSTTVGGAASVGDGFAKQHSVVYQVGTADVTCWLILYRKRS